VVASVLGFVVLVIAIASGILPQLVVLVGLFAAAIGVYALLVGSARRFRVKSRKFGAVIVGAGLLFAMAGGAAGAATYTPQPASLASGSSSTSDDATAPTTSAKPTPTPTPTPVVTQEEVREPVVIPFEITTVDDSNLAVGTTALSTAGVNGEKAIVHLVTYTDGIETGRLAVREEVTVQPVTQVTAVGTKQPVVVAPAPAPAPPAAGGGCDANYSGVCVPIASDVDCAGGSGNGPAYVRGPLQVVGPDVYDLDRDGDGIACD
jgi:hypothetical protein